jgi:cytochrome c-type biogenesis protein
MNEENLSYAVAFIAGFLTFLSPCFLPLIPSYLVYITGISLDDLTRKRSGAELKRRTIIHSLLFIAGFSLVFILLGLTATLIGKALFRYQKFIRIAGGVLIILFGLQLMGILNLNFLAKERRVRFARKGIGYLSSFLIGVTFAAAWTPCAGVILGSILVLAGTKANVAAGAKFLTVYSLGIAIPFFVSSLLINSFLIYSKKAQKFIGAITYVSGAFLILVGIAILTNYFQVMTNVVDRFLSQFIEKKGAH